MKKIEPYRNVEEAISKLDNGGRFYNIMTKAEDGIISPAELGKVGGIFNDKQKMILFLELSISRLDECQKARIISTLEDGLQVSYRHYKPQELLPSEAHVKGLISTNAIITGIPELKESKSDFTGFLMIPIMTGKVMILTMIPLYDQYDVYELKDDDSSETFLIAHAKGSEKLPNRLIKVAGVLKELKANETEKVASKKFLEAVYHMELT